MNKKRRAIVLVIPVVIALAFAWSFSAMAQTSLDDFDSDTGTWSFSGGSVWDSGAGNVVFTPTSQINKTYTPIGTGQFIIDFDWYYTGQPFTVTLQKLTGGSSTIERPLSSMACNATIAESAWNDCQIIETLLTENYSVIISATTGRIDNILIQPHTPTTSTPTPTLTTGPTSTPTPTPTGTPVTPTPTPAPSYWLGDPFILSNVVQYSGTSAKGSCNIGALTCYYPGNNAGQMGFVFDIDNFPNDVAGYVALADLSALYLFGPYYIPGSAGVNLTPGYSAPLFSFPAAAPGTMRYMCSLPSGVTAGDVMGLDTCDTTSAHALSVPIAESYFDGFGLNFGSANEVNLALTAIYPVRYSVPPEPTPDPAPDPSFPAFCGITTTITTTAGITTTISYSATANLVENGSFETGSLQSYLDAYGWLPVMGGVEYNPAPYRYNTGDARTGTYHVQPSESFELWYQELKVLPAGNLVAGFYASCEDGDTCGDVELFLDASSVTSTGGALYSTYQSYSGTVASGGGAPSLILDMGSNTRIDDVFLYPVDGNGNIICSADYYTPSTACLENGTNILRNPSFENYFSLWNVDGVSLDSEDTFSNDASDGLNSIYIPPGELTTICQSVYLPDNVSSLTVSYDVKTAGTGDRLVYTSWYTHVLSVDTISNVSWQTVTDNNTVISGKAGDFCILIPAGDAGIHLDNFELIALDDSSNNVCLSSDETTPPTPTPTPTPTPVPAPDDFPAPDPGSGGACYDCLWPEDWYQLGQWIRWLWCGISNLYWCYLYILLLEARNFIVAIYQHGLAWLSWIPLQISNILSWVGGGWAAFVSWLGSTWSGFVAWLSNLPTAAWAWLLNSAFIQAIWTLVDFVVAAGARVWAMVLLLYQLVWQLINNAGDFIAALYRLMTTVIGAFSVSPHDAESVWGYALIDLEPSGMNAESVLYFVLIGVMTADTFAGLPEFSILLYVVMGLLSFGVIRWTLKKIAQLQPFS